MNFTEFKIKEFPGKKFKSALLKQAGKIFKKSGPDEAKKFLSEKYDSDYVKRDFQPPAYTNIISLSRPLTEWPIYKCSEEIQKYVYSLSYDKFKELNPGTSKTTHDEWFAKTGVDAHGYRDVQGLNKIFNNAKSIYEGVLLKVKNRNDKKRKKVEEKNIWLETQNRPAEEFKEETALDDNGYLINPPGINHNIYTYQQTKVRPVDPVKDKEKLPTTYLFKPTDIIPCGVPVSRCDIPKGTPGYIPDFQRPQVNLKRQRMRLSKKDRSQNALYGVLNIGNDWIIFDVRGLLRNVYWRKLSDKNTLSIDSLLNLFTGDPVIDPKRNRLTFIYKDGVIKNSTQKNCSYKKSLEILEKNAPCTLISMDLGQTHPVSARISRVKKSSKGFIADTIDLNFLPKHLLDEISHYRNKCDELEEKLHQDAVKLLIVEQQTEIEVLNNFNSDKAKQIIANKYNILLQNLPWNEMTSNSTFIASEFIKNGGLESDVICNFTKKKITDFDIFKSIKPKLSSETRKALTEKEWELKKTSPGYLKLSKQKSELSRRCINYIISKANGLYPNTTIILNKENLNVRIFTGSGKREPGWNNFFARKKENRWLIPALDKAITDVAQNKGMIVIESNPSFTSQTCPKCRSCNKENRFGEKFECLNCGSTFNADLEVATFNLEQIVLTGTKLPGPPKDASSPVVKKMRKPLARAKSVKNQRKVEQDSDEVLSEVKLDDDLSQTTP